MIRIQRVGDVRFKVGEGPVWDVTEQALYLIDLLDCSAWRHDPATEKFERWALPSMVGSMALCAQGGALVALQDGLYTLDFDSGHLAKLCDPQQGNAETQCNDGKVDPRGRFIVGTQARSLQDARPLGALFTVEPDGQFRQLDEGFGITNGPCWSPDGTVLYFANSSVKHIYAYDYDVRTGAASNRRLFADTTSFGGIPDGATVDRQGRLWTAVCGAGKVVCYRPDGEVDLVIDMPVNLVSSVMFGGPSLDRLYVTTLDAGVLGLGLPSEELGGSLFVIDGLAAQGLPEHRFAR